MFIIRFFKVLLFCVYTINFLIIFFKDLPPIHARQNKIGHHCVLAQHEVKLSLLAATCYRVLNLVYPRELGSGLLVGQSIVFVMLLNLFNLFK